MPSRKQIKPIDTDQLLTGRLMPQAIELEEAVIGACLIDTNAVKIVGDILQVNDFHSLQNRTIYEAIKTLYDHGSPIDLLTVYDQLIRMGKLDEVGGIGHLTLISSKIGSIANLEAHAKIVQETAIRREIIKIGSNTIAKAFEGKEYAPELISEAISELDGSNRIAQRPKSISDSYKEVIELGEVKGLYTGFNKLDQITNGLWGYIVLAAGPGEGKSVFALNVAKKVALRGIPVLIVSLEMKTIELMFRLISDEQNIPVREVMANKYNADEAMRSRIPELPLTILDNGSMTVEDLAAHAKGMFKRQKGLIIIDYLQLLTTNKKTNNREQEIATISRRLKQLQMELDIPILALSQLSRDKNRKYYQLSDLRESGALEQDANGVIFIFRPHIHHMNDFIIGGVSESTTESDAVISIAKWRLGDLGEFMMTFNGKCSRFEDKGTQFAPMPEFESQIIGIKQNLNDIPF